MVVKINKHVIIKNKEYSRTAIIIITYDESILN